MNKQRPWPGAPNIHAVSTDVRQPDSVRALFAGAREKFGRLDVLFNNAGVNATLIPFEDLSYEQWDEVVNVNLTGSFLCAQEAFRMMKAQPPQGGRIINNGSISRMLPPAALRALHRHETCHHRAHPLDRARWPPHNIACGQIDIGNAGLEMSGKPGSAALQANGEMMVEPRMDARHIGEAVVFMASLHLDANVLFMTVMATNMPFVGRG